ncbi:glycosyltransferase family 2 protein, partial [Ralstonia pseudosolanacearum]|uniref:glycosyltransferase family 2 protein n=1 Tax=Ralstonia pseudosolanacearum TaxID=1310165 RepID=UPI003D172AC6
MKVFIAIPSMDTVPALFCQSLALLQRAGDTVVGFQVGSLVYNARNELAKQAIKSEADWVLWLDSDMVFEPNLLNRMLEVCKENDIDFLTGLCFRRKPPYTPTLFDRLEKVGHGASYTAIMSVPDGRFKVGGCGFAGVLMSTDVLLSVAAKFGGRMFDPMEGFGEDVSFCWRARQCGYEIWCDSEIEL